MRTAVWPAFLAAAITASGRPARGERIEPLLDEVRFQRGFKVVPPAWPPQVSVRVIRPGADAADPGWSLSQWYSRFNLADAPAKTLPGGAVQYRDAAKSITFFPDRGEADLGLGLNGTTEYRGTPPRIGDAWPHLLAGRPLLARPSLTGPSALRFVIRYRLVRAEVHRPPGFDAARHTAQFNFYLIIANRGAKSAGKGDYYWFGVPMYDARWRQPPPLMARDSGTDRKVGTEKFIYNPASQTYTAQSAHDGKWITIDKDLLPLIREGLRAAWDHGFLGGSHDAADYAPADAFFGWEVTGTLDVEMYLKGLKLEAVYH
jgi:hypothetical protein